jgi:hypothetical protein
MFLSTQVQIQSIIKKLFPIILIPQHKFSLQFIANNKLRLAQIYFKKP